MRRDAIHGKPDPGNDRRASLRCFNAFLLLEVILECRVIAPARPWEPPTVVCPRTAEAIVGRLVWTRSAPRLRSFATAAGTFPAAGYNRRLAIASEATGGSKPTYSFPRYWRLDGLEGLFLRQQARLKAAHSLNRLLSGTLRVNHLTRSSTVPCYSTSRYISRHPYFPLDICSDPDNL